MDAGTITSSPATLRLRWPLGRGLAVALAIAALVAATAEGLARTDTVRRHLPTPSVGCGHPQLDAKLVLLDEAVKRDGPVEGMFFGSSMVYRGIDPVTVGEAFRSATGHDLRSFNFGLGGLSGAGEVPLAEIVVDKFRPRWMVLGVSPFALDDDRGVRLTERLLAHPWIRRHQGEPSLDGWLVEHSNAFRAYLGLRFWVLDPTSKADRLRNLGLMDGMMPNGFGFSEPAPFPDTDAKAVEYFSSYEVSPAQVESLSRLLRLHAALPIVVAEIPVHDSVRNRFGRGDDAYRSGLEAIARATAAAGVPFWRYPADRPIPQDGWENYTHMNGNGAKLYSLWLGERLADAARQGLLGARAL